MLSKIENYIPYDCYKTVYDIDYNKLYEKGKKIILMDIDNTLIPYDVSSPEEKLIDLINSILEIGFRIVFISNNHKKRVKAFADIFNSDYVYSAWKPLKKGYKKALKLTKHEHIDEIIAIGDQVMTDVLGANKVGIKCILVKPLKIVNEKWYTKLNRRIENRIINKLKKNHYEEYLKIKELKDI
ncbi:MAG: YqeG family HAD IIIA-type phosphatase [Bacilli bacterium]|nr:YqeG family HAD IIIA-type phosphatase [Bacilli bacterium]